MKSLVIILRDALASSFVGALETACALQRAGGATSVIITQEALAAATTGTLSWPSELSAPAIRTTLADNGKPAGLPLLGRGEGRQLDARGMLTRANEAGVAIYACPIWMNLLGCTELEGPIQKINEKRLVELLSEADEVIGAL